MRYRLGCIIMICIILIVALFGIYKRQTYTDITGEENYLERLYVAQLSEQLIINCSDDMLQKLPKCPIILKVVATENIEYFFGGGRQKVRVKEIYCGKDIEVEEEIYLISNHWMLCLDGNPNSIQCGFVNIMKINYEYLVFVSNKVSSLDSAIPIYELYEDTIITPIFGYQDFVNIVAPMEEGGTSYVLYEKVKNNEFFSQSEKGIELWNELKTKVIGLYSD